MLYIKIYLSTLLLSSGEGRSSMSIMNKKTIFLFIPLLTILFISFVFSQEKGGGGEAAEGKGSISGKVLPIDSNATVYVNYPSQSSIALKIAGFATIDDNGEYIIPVPAGIYNIIVISKGYYTDRSASQIEVKENQITEIEDITLTKSINAGSISGFINPIVGGTAVVIKKHGANKFDSFDIVAKDGSYEFTDLEPNTYGLFVSAPNFYDYKWGMIDIIANTSLSGFILTLTPINSSYLLDRIMIKFQPGVTEEEKENIIESYNCTLMEHYEYSQTYTVNIPRDKTVEEMVELFKTNSKVKSAYPVGISYTGEAIIIEEEQKPEIQSNISEPEEIEPEESKVLEGKDLLLLWATIFVIILVIGVYLIIKFRRR